jgi:hypothetical protein
VVLAALAWWPVGFSGTASWLHVPLRLVAADTVFVGSLAAAAGVCALTRAPWPRFLIVAGMSALGWVLTGPATPEDYELMLLLAALAGGGLVGMLVGARVHRGVMPAATSLAVVAALTPLGWLRGPLLAAALALPFLLATRDRVAPTVLGVLRALLAWLAASLLALAMRYGWDTVRPGMGLREPGPIAEEVRSRSWDLLRTSWRQAVESSLSGASQWFWVAGALALLIVIAQAATAKVRRRPATAGRRRT